MEVLAFRAAYPTRIEWLFFTNYGWAKFDMRTQGQRASIETQVETRKFGYLRELGVGGVKRSNAHIKMQRRASEAGAIVHQVELATIAEIDDQFGISKIVQHDTKANNAWCNITGRPVGTTFESVVVKAEETAREQRQMVLEARAKEMAAVDAEWGMF